MAKPQSVIVTHNSFAMHLNMCSQSEAQAAFMQAVWCRAGLLNYQPAATEDFMSSQSTVRRGS